MLTKAILHLCKENRNHYLSNDDNVSKHLFMYYPPNFIQNYTADTIKQWYETSYKAFVEKSKTE